MTRLPQDTAELLKCLGGPGGGWCNLWGGPEYSAIWYPAGQRPAAFPDHWDAVYFSLAPRITRLSGHKRGGLAELLYLTCLYSELDEKEPMGTRWEDILALDPEPSCIVRSGGGWHCYWFIHPVQLTDTNRDALNQLQHRWTNYTGGDPGAPDISRVLRLPGSLNKKYTPPRMVVINTLAAELRYDHRDLAALLPEVVKEPAGGLEDKSTPRTITQGGQPCSTDYWLQRAIDQARPGLRNKTGLWLACQLRDSGASQDTALSVLYDYQKAVDNPKDPYNRQEAKDTVKSAYRRVPPNRTAPEKRTA